MAAYPNMNAGNMTPFLASAELTLAAGATGNADSEALSVPYRRPFWLDEVRWNIRVSPVPLNFGAGLGVPYGALISTKLALGRMIISDKFIPIWNYGAEMLSAWSDSAQVDPNFGSTNVGFSSYRWKLPKPLYVPAGNVVTSQFARGADTNPAARIVVSYAGRYADGERPSRNEIDVPFVAAFLPGVVANAQSSDLDLVNPFLVPLHCQRLIGRMLVIDSNTTPYGYTEGNFLHNITAQINDSFGHNVVRDFTDLGLICDTNRRAWTFNKVLNPQERYNLQATGMRTSAVADQISVSLIGTRKEWIA